MIKRLFAYGHRLVLVAVFSLSSLSSCSNFTLDQTPTEKLIAQFGEDSYYYLGLTALDEKNEEIALQHFMRARENGSHYVAERSAECLTKIGTKIQRIQAANYLADNFTEDSALNVACEQLELYECYSDIARVTRNIDIKTSPDSLIKTRLNALYELKDPAFEKELFSWITNRASSYNQYDLFQKYLVLKEEQYLQKVEKLQKEHDYKLQRFEEEKQFMPVSAQNSDSLPAYLLEEFVPPEMEISDQQVIMDFRMSVFLKDYKIALEKEDAIFKLYEEKNFDIPLLFSDRGKIHLYGTTDFLKSARQMDKIASTASDNTKFYAYFYAGRLYSKIARNTKETLARFKSAIQYSTDGAQYDNALWYLLDTQLRSSTNDIIQTLKDYGQNIHDPYYFDNFFDSLSTILLGNQKWQDFYDVWQIIDGYASPEISCRYAYIAGRLIEEGLAKGKQGLATRQAVEAYTKVLYGKADLYYKLCALERLNILDDDTIINILCYNGKEPSAEIDTQAERLLYGYCAFNFPQRVYNEWLLLRKKIGPECSVHCAQYLRQCGNLNDDFNVPSIRLASRAKENVKGKIPRELLILSHPRFFEEEISQACQEFEVSEPLMLALIRSESFFDHKIQSHAGAQGLTQLMQATAEEEAKKLGIDELQILDPKTNVRIGTHYLSSLINRIDGNYILPALFAYNAGIKNVRKWISQAKKDWSFTGKYSHKLTGISMDLFLEIIPFEESREYGRKLVSATTMYNWLYYNKTPAESVRIFMDN